MTVVASDGKGRKTQTGGILQFPRVMNCKFATPLLRHLFREAFLGRESDHKTCVKLPRDGWDIGAERIGPGVRCPLIGNISNLLLLKLAHSSSERFDCC